MLIVPHALHCVDGCCFVFYLFWHIWLNVLGSVYYTLPPRELENVNFSLLRIHIKNKKIKDGCGGAMGGGGGGGGG